MSEHVNPFETAARYRKALALVNAIDRSALAHRIDPIRDPIRVVAWLKLATPEWWELAARDAHVKPPTDPTPAGHTVKAVIGIYLDRAAANLRRSS